MRHSLRWLHKAAEIAADVEGSCSYRSATGLRCAVGFLLSDNKWMAYKWGVVALVTSRAFRDSEDFHGPNHDFIVENVDLLTVVQGIHDSAAIAPYDLRVLQSYLDTDVPDSVREWCALWIRQARTDQYAAIN